MDYAASFYELCFRELIKDIAEYCNSNTEEREKKKKECALEKEGIEEGHECVLEKEMIEDELEYIRKKFENKKIRFLFEHILNKDTYYRWIDASLMADIIKGEGQGRFGGVDFTSIRKNGKAIEDIIWILKLSFAKYPKAKNEDKEGCETDRSSYGRFEKLLSEIDFPNGEDQLFYYDEDTLYFNGLVDNGDMIYSLKQESNVAYGNIWRDKNEGLFLNALKLSNLQVMHQKLKDLLNLYNKFTKEKSTQEIDAQKVIQMAAFFSDLVPIIDKDSKLKDEEQVQKERVAVRFGVVNHFLMQGMDVNGELGNTGLRNNFDKYFENHILIKTLFKEIYNRENINKEQVLVLIEGYLDFLEQSMELFNDKVRQYQGICEKFLGTIMHNSIDMYRDMWEKVWNAELENE